MEESLRNWLSEDIMDEFRIDSSSVLTLVRFSGLYGYEMKFSEGSCVYFMNESARYKGKDPLNIEFGDNSKLVTVFS